MTNVTSLGSFDDCVDCLDGRDGRVLRNNVRLVRDGADITVVHHATAIIRYRPDGTVVLDCNGYRSATTKANLNRYSPCSVYQEKRVWYVQEVYGGRQDGDDELDTQEFEDGMEVSGPVSRSYKPDLTGVML